LIGRVEPLIAQKCVLPGGNRAVARGWVVSGMAALLMVAAFVCSAIWTATGFERRNVIADREFVRIVSGFPKEHVAMDALTRAGLAVGRWGRSPEQYLAVWRRPLVLGDRLVDMYYQFTDRGSRRLLGTVHFDPLSPAPADREMTSYSRQLAPFKVFKTSAPLSSRMHTSTTATLLPRDTGYRGIWYMNQPQDDEYRYKYSGGFATYPQQHIPMAVYAPAVNKTFFCYGGTRPGEQRLLHMVSYFDHVTSTVPRPVILLDKNTSDAHDNPILNIDDAGYIWVFSPSHGGARPCYIHRSTRPYDIESFESIPTSNFSYPQAWYVPGEGWLFLHTRYEKGRSLYWSTSRDGRQWTSGSQLARFGEGHYQVSNRDTSDQQRPSGETRIATAFNFHPSPGGLNARTNLYYLETSQSGKTWRSAAGVQVRPPITTTGSAALVHDYQSEGLLVYLKDLVFDRAKHPVILYLTSRGYESGPKNDPRTWYTARWSGRNWVIRPVTTSDNNYDFGSLYIEPDGTWRLIAPTEPGPQKGNPGGEIVMWTSNNEGTSWTKVRQLTHDSSRNHTYVRRPLNANQEFYAFWADGNAREPSDSSLYFATRGGDVYRLPQQMSGESATPELVR
jgi:hypothetical protein